MRLNRTTYMPGGPLSPRPLPACSLPRPQCPQHQLTFHHPIPSLLLPSSHLQVVVTLVHIGLHKIILVFLVFPFLVCPPNQRLASLLTQVLLSTILAMLVENFRNSQNVLRISIFVHSWRFKKFHTYIYIY